MSDDEREGEELVELAKSNPRESRERALEGLKRAGTPSARSALWRAVGVAERELGLAAESVANLERARAEARRSGAERLMALADLSWSASASFSGDFDEAVAVCRRAARVLGSPEGETALHQLAGVLGRSGRFEEAVAIADQCIALLGGTDPQLEADVLQNSGLALGYLGRYQEARQRTTAALALFEAAGIEKSVVDVIHNLGWLAARQGDLGEANRLLQDAELRYGAIERDDHSALWADRAEAKRMAGLWHEAYGLLVRCTGEPAESGYTMDEADALVLRARVAVRIGRYDEAEKDAEDAALAYRRAKRWPWWAAASVVAARSRRAAGRSAGGDVRRCRQAMLQLSGTLAAEAVDCRLLLAELALDRDEMSVARFQLGKLAQLDGVGSLDEIAIAAVRARLERIDGHPQVALDACRAGLVGLARLRSSTGALELQAHVGAHASALTDEGLAAALVVGDAKLVLEWVEWRRGVALAVPPVRVADDSLLAASVDRLRHLEWSGGGDGVERGRLQTAIADRARRVGGRSWVVDPTDTVGLQVSLAGRILIHLFDDGEVMRAVVTGPGETTALYEVGKGSEVDREGVLLATSLRRALRRPITDDVVARLRREAASLDAYLARLISKTPGPVVLCPPPGLAGVPWGLLPSLADRDIVVAPTARVLGRTARTAHGHVVLVSSNGLPNASSETKALIAVHPDATLLSGGDATCRRVLDAMSGASIVHFACHGTFNAESPLFSALTLADGPLYGYDLATVPLAPAVVTMAACQTAETGGAGLEEVLGLSTVLLAHGTIGVLAAHPDVPDSQDTASVSTIVHRALAEGGSLASGLRAARTAHPVVGAAFQVIGDDASVSVGTSLTRPSSGRA